VAEECRGELEHATVLAVTQRLRTEEEVVPEATGNPAAIVRLLTPFVARVMIANPLLMKAIALARVKTDKLDARILALQLASGFLPKVRAADDEAQGLQPPGSERAALVRLIRRVNSRVQAVRCRGLAVQPTALFDGLRLDLLPLAQDSVLPKQWSAGVGLPGLSWLSCSTRAAIASSKASGRSSFLARDAVLERPGPAPDLALGLRVVRSAADVVDALTFKPGGKVDEDGGQTVVREQPWTISDDGAVAAGGRQRIPWGPPAVAVTHPPGRHGRDAMEILTGFAGRLQVDGYPGPGA
jgi:hypothetical protein